MKIIILLLNTNKQFDRPNSSQCCLKRGFALYPQIPMNHPRFKYTVGLLIEMFSFLWVLMEKDSYYTWCSNSSSTEGRRRNFVTKLKECKKVTVIVTLILKVMVIFLMDNPITKMTTAENFTKVHVYGFPELSGVI